MIRRWFTLLLALTTPAIVLAADQNLRIGTGTGCTHADLGSALLSIANDTGTHTLRINKGTYLVANGMEYVPIVNQTGVYLEGGYADCLAAAPSGDPTSDAHRAVFDGAGGLQRSVLHLRLDGRVGTFQIRRIVLRGGDAVESAPDDFNESGGGLMVRGQASVLIGIGTTIRNNTALNGGGVALAGSTLNSPGSRIDFFVDDGAEIRNNTAMARGGGVYCGGDTSLRHGSLVLRSGTIGYNVAPEGAAFFCRGSLEGGGGFQPRPFAGSVAWIIGNQSTGSGAGCAAGAGTLDTVLPVEADGFRLLGAAAGSNGLVAVTANTGDSPGLCLFGSRSSSAPGDPAPLNQSRFRLRNLYVSDQTGSGFMGLRAGDGLALIVEPSSDTVSCTFFTATPCVRFFNNAIDSGPSEGRLLYANGDSLLQLRRAMIDDNAMRPDLAMAEDGGDLILLGSIVDGNTVGTRSIAPNTSSLFAARFDGVVDLRNSTVISRSALSEFFRLGWAPLTDNTGIAYAQASIFASTSGVPANVGYESGVPTTNFRRYWCGFFQSTSDFAGHTVVNDPGSGSFQVLAPSAFSLDADYVPLSAGLRDACTNPTINRDYYGRPYGAVLEPASPVHADIGAVEAQLQDAVFANGFET